ncbi:hypothetical protein GCM10010363_26210 [Streptomyces omiyaensis]|nr:hypothetical protein GCM10010363_26210 [Streptomyces omiyaensis]
MTACPAAVATEVGSVTVTSMIATLEEAMMPAVGPAAQARPERKVHSSSRARKRIVCDPVRYPRKVETARLPPEASASVGRGRQDRWKVAMAAWNAPNADAAATAGPKTASEKPTTSARPSAPRAAMTGASRRRSTVRPERAVSLSARSQLMDRA